MAASRRSTSGTEWPRRTRSTSATTTGRRPALETLRRALGITDPDPEVDQDPEQHSGLVVYGNDRTGQWAAAPGLVRAEALAAAVRRVARAH